MDSRGGNHTDTKSQLRRKGKVARKQNELMLPKALRELKGTFTKLSREDAPQLKAKKGDKPRMHLKWLKLDSRSL